MHSKIGNADSMCFSTGSILKPPQLDISIKLAPYAMLAPPILNNFKLSAEWDVLVEDEAEGSCLKFKLV